MLVGLTVAAGANPGFWDESNRPKNLGRVARTMAASMDAGELAGQVLMLGYTGTRPSSEFLDWVREAGIGGVKVFGWNSTDLVALAEGLGEMQRTASRTRLQSPLLVATDQEGGWVRHVKGATSETPGNLAIGATGKPLDAYNTGFYIGAELSALGINMNFAPTVDVYLHPNARVIGPRAFSADPIATAILSVAYFRGLEKAGVVATAKHFPGHGNTDQDSHSTLPVITDSLDVIWDRDLVPYRLLVREGLPAIMTGHLSYPAITGDNSPASLSAYFQREIIRGRLGFEGMVITDDMRMYGARQDGMDAAEVCVRALKAGNDMVLISRPFEVQRQVWRRISDEIRSDAAFKKRISEAVERVLELKYRYLWDRGEEGLVPRIDQIGDLLPNREARAFFFDLAYRSVSVIRGAGIPTIVPPSSDEILLVGHYAAFFEQGMARFPAAESLQLPSSGLSEAEARTLRGAAEDRDLIILCLANEASLEALKELETFGPQVIVMSALTPVFLREAPWVRSAIAVYGTGDDSFRAGFAALLGDFVPEGRVPIAVFSDKR